MHTSHLIHIHCLFDIFHYCDCSELMVIRQLFLAITSFIAAVAVNSNAADVDVLPTCESVNATDANCKVYCRDSGYDTTLDGSVGGSVYDEYENSWTGVGSHSCVCKNMDSSYMTTVCQTIVSTASPTAAPVPCNLDLEAARADDGSLPTCASMGITKITCHEACCDNGSTWSWSVSDAIGRCECGTFDFDIYWLCADQELPSGASASSGFMAISVALVASVLL